MRTYIFAALVLTACQAMASEQPDCPEGTTAVGNGCYAGVQKKQNKLRPRTKHLLVETEDGEEDKEPYEGYDEAMEMELDALLGSQEYEYETPKLENRGHFGDASCNFIRSFAKKNPRVKNSHPHCFGKK